MARRNQPVESAEKKGESPKTLPDSVQRLHGAIDILTLSASELLHIAVGDIGNPLRLALADGGITVLVNLGPIADTEVDVGELTLRLITVDDFDLDLLTFDGLLLEMRLLHEQGFEVLGVEVLTRPHVEIDNDTAGPLNARTVHEDCGNRILLRLRSELRSEVTVVDIHCTEVQGTDIIDIRFLRKIDVSHGVLN